MEPVTRAEPASAGSRRGTGQSRRNGAETVCTPGRPDTIPGMTTTSNDRSASNGPDFDEATATLDDWRWHVEGQFPAGQAPEQGYVHIGVFTAWLIGRGLLDAGWVAEAGLVTQVIDLAQRRVAPCALLEPTSGRLVRAMLGADGAAFSGAYYAPQYGYPSDWRHVFGRAADRYDVPGDWTTFDRIAPVIDGRYNNWTRGGRPELMPLPGPLGLVSRLLRPRRA